MEHGTEMLFSFIGLFAGDGTFCHSYKLAGFDLDDIAVFSDAIDSAVNTADGDNPVSDLQVAYQILMFLLPFALRPDNQEIEYCE